MNNSSNWGFLVLLPLYQPLATNYTLFNPTSIKESCLSVKVCLLYSSVQEINSNNGYNGWSMAWFVIAFIHDILIYSNSLEEHIQLVKRVLKRLIQIVQNHADQSRKMQVRCSLSGNSWVHYKKRGGCHG